MTGTKRENVLYIRLIEPTFKRVYKLSKETGMTMSEIGRLCIDLSIAKAEEIYKDVRVPETSLKELGIEDIEE